MSAAAELAPMTINGKSVPVLPKQAEFLDLCSQVKYPLYVGGFGAGKSWVLSYGSIEFAAEYPGVDQLFACLTYPLLRDSIVPTYVEVLGLFGLEEGRDWIFNISSSTLTLHCFTDGHGRPTRILFRPVDGPTNERRIISLNVGASWCDEVGLWSESAHRRVRERTRDRRGPCTIASATTPEGLNWLHDRYASEPRERAAEAGLDGTEWAEDEQWLYVRGRTADNPYLDPSYVEELRSTYPEHLIDAYLDGHWVPMSEGRVFKHFSESRHVTAQAEYNESLPIHLTCDFNVNPMCWSLGHFHKREFWTFDEITMENSTTDEACRELLSRYWSSEAIEHYSGITVFGDASGRARSTKAHGTDYDIIADFLREMPGYVDQIPSSNPTHKNSANEVNAVLLNGAGISRYAVHPRCREVIRSMLETRWAKNSATSQIEKTEDSYEHHSDAIRYWIHQLAPINESLAHGRGRRGGARRAAA